MNDDDPSLRRANGAQRTHMAEGWTSTEDSHMQVEDGIEVTVWRPFPGAPAEGLQAFHYAPCQNLQAARVTKGEATYIVHFIPVPCMGFTTPDGRRYNGEIGGWMTDLKGRFDLLPPDVQRDLEAGEFGWNHRPQFKVTVLNGPAFEPSAPARTDLDALLMEIRTTLAQPDSEHAWANNPELVQSPDAFHRMAWVAKGATGCMHCGHDKTITMDRPGTRLYFEAKCKACGKKSYLQYSVAATEPTLPHTADHIEDWRICAVCGKTDNQRGRTEFDDDKPLAARIVLTCKSTSTNYFDLLVASEGQERIGVRPSLFW